MIFPRKIRCLFIRDRTAVFPHVVENFVENRISTLSTVDKMSISELALVLDIFDYVVHKISEV